MYDVLTAALWPLGAVWVGAFLVLALDFARPWRWRGLPVRWFWAAQGGLMGGYALFHAALVWRAFSTPDSAGGLP